MGGLVGSTEGYRDYYPELNAPGDPFMQFTIFNSYATGTVRGSGGVGGVVGLAMDGILEEVPAQAPSQVIGAGAYTGPLMGFSFLVEVR